ncbi:HSP20-like chaperone [Chytriomyces sp. MP71]|nr:HSP20-like chaperone [Chytriomyces sp. MP71]
MERRMNALFEDHPFFLAPSSPRWTTFTSLKGPVMDISETENAYVFTVDLPGMKKSEMSITLKDNILTISGERQTSVDEKNEQRHVVERASGSFSRSISLPKDAKQDGIVATMEDGVLKLEIAKQPVPPEEGMKKVEIQ